MTNAKLDAMQLQRLQDIASERGITVEQLVDQLLNATLPSFFDESAGLLCVVSEDGTLLSVNAAFCNALAYTPEDIVGQSITQFTHPDEHDTITTLLHDPNTEVEMRLRDANSVYRWVNFACSAAKNGHIYLTGHDVNDRKHNEVILQTDTEHITMVLESIADGFFAIDQDWRITYLNNVAEKMLFRNRSDLIGHIVWEEFPEAMHSKFYTECNRAVDEQVTVRFTERYEPLETWFEVTAYPADHGLAVYFRDVSERVQMESRLQNMVNELEQRVRLRTQELVQTNIQLQLEVTERQTIEAALREEEERFRLLTESTSDLICLHDPQGTYLYVSPSIKQLAGYTSDDLIGNNPYDYFHPDDIEMIQERSHANALNGDASFVSYRYRCKDGRYIWLETSTRPIFNEQREVVQLVTSSRDVTIRKQLETELVIALQAERRASELRQHFFSMLSHEFRVPLATILSSADLLRLYMNRMTDDQKSTHFMRIQSQVKYLTTVVDTIIELSKAQTVGLAFAPQPTDIEDYMERLVEEMRTMAQPTHTIALAADINCGMTDTDTHLLRMIVTNLLSNAIKYSPKADRVDVYLDCERTSNTLMITVKDYGIGIPPDDVDRIFEHFHRAGNVGDIKGSGLGLQLTYLAIKAHHGDIQVNSTLDVGTTFMVTLPLRQSL